MTHQDYIKRRDEILDAIVTYYASDVDVAGMALEMTTEQAQQAIDELVLAVIGENAKNPYGKDPVMIDYGQKLADYGEFIRLSQRFIVKGGE